MKTLPHQIIHFDRFVRHGFNRGGGRAFATISDHTFDLRDRTTEHSLNRPVGAVPNPTIKTEIARDIHCPRAKPDPLHTAGDPHPDRHDRSWSPSHYSNSTMA